MVWWCILVEWYRMALMMCIYIEGEPERPTSRAKPSQASVVRGQVHETSIPKISRVPCNKASHYRHLQPKPSECMTAWTGRYISAGEYVVRWLLNTQAKRRTGASRAESTWTLTIQQDKLFTITGGDQQQRRIFLLFYFHFILLIPTLTIYQRWHGSIRCHARPTSENFHGIAYCCLHETSTVNLQ